MGLTEALQKSVGRESCFLDSDPVPFSLLPVAQKVVALRKKQQLSIGPCKSLPNSPSHSSVSAASIPSVHINQVGNGNGESQGPHRLLHTPSVHSIHSMFSLALDLRHSPGVAFGKSRVVVTLALLSVAQNSLMLALRSSFVSKPLGLAHGLQRLWHTSADTGGRAVSSRQGSSWAGQKEVSERGLGLAALARQASLDGRSCPWSCSPWKREADGLPCICRWAS